MTNQPGHWAQLEALRCSATKDAAADTMERWNPEGLPRRRVIRQRYQAWATTLTASAPNQRDATSYQRSPANRSERQQTTDKQRIQAQLDAETLDVTAV